MNEIIYFVSEEPFSGMIKIGKTNDNINKRLASIQTGNPRKLVCLMQIDRPKKYDYEKLFHKLFSDRFIRGEWYSMDRLMLEKIRILTSGDNLINELKSLCDEFLNNDSKFCISDDKIIIGVPPEHSNRCASKLHGNTRSLTKKQINKKIHKLSDFKKLADTKIITKQLYKNMEDQIKSGIIVDENESYYQMKKYRLMKFYGIVYDEQENNDSSKNSIFNNEKYIILYSSEKVMSFYKDMIYRDLPIELIEKIDAISTANMTDKDKLTYKYLSDRHAIITQIREIFKGGEVGYGIILNYMKILYEKKIPQFAKFTEPTNQILISMIDKLIRPYGFKAKSRRTGKGDDRKRMMFIKDYAAEIFEIKVLPFDADVITKCITLQMGQFNKPVALVYSY